MRIAVLGVKQELLEGIPDLSLEHLPERVSELGRSIWDVDLVVVEGAHPDASLIAFISKIVGKKVVCIGKPGSRILRDLTDFIVTEDQVTDLLRKIASDSIASGSATSQTSGL